MEKYRPTILQVVGKGAKVNYLLLKTHKCGPECGKKFHYEDLEPETDYRTARWIELKKQSGIACSRSVSLLLIDVDRPDEFPGTNLGKILSANDATRVASDGSGRFHIGLDMRGWTGEWPTQGPSADGVYDVKSNGVARTAPAYEATRDIWAPSSAKTTAILAAIADDRPSGANSSGDLEDGWSYEDITKPGMAHKIGIRTARQYKNGGLKRDAFSLLIMTAPLVDSHGTPYSKAKKRELVKNAWDDDYGFVPAKQEGARKGRVTRASDIKIEPVYWAWAGNGYGRIPVGELTLIAGYGDVGKSQLNILLISRITTGDLPGHFFGVPRFCLIAASEDDWEKTIVPRLIAAGADLDMVGRFDVVTEMSPDGTKVSLPQDYAELETAIADNDAAWVFLESVVSAFSIAKSTNSGQDVRSTLEPLAGIARRQNCVIIGSVHFNKNSTANAMDRMNGSGEFRNVARAVIYMAMEADGTGVISKAKNNLGKPWPSISYRFTEVVVQKGTDDQREIKAPFLELIDETDADASDLITAVPGKSRKPTAIRLEIIEVLQELFKEQDEWKRTDINDQLKKAGVSVNPRTVGEAMKDIGARPEAIRTPGKPGVNYWIWTTKPVPKRRLPPSRAGAGAHVHPVSKLL